MTYQIRKAENIDIPALLELMREFAEFEKLSQFLEITEEKLREALFGEGAFAKCLVAADGEKIFAYAIYFPHYSSFRGQTSVYLEDIFISENYRGAGAGEKLIREVAKSGKLFGAERMDFQVLEWNAPAVGFYKKLGAAIDTQERHFKITDEAFIKLAR